MTFKENLKELFNLKESDFDTHESDLYVRNTDVMIQEYLRKEGLTFELFIDSIDKQSWINIAFMNEDFWNNKQKNR